MMTSTASVQVNLDAGPQAGWAARVRLAHALGPTMIAIAANSPMLGGEFSGWVSTRQWVWGQMDSARCGPILGVSGDDPGTDWARYALKAPVMLVNNPGTADCAPVTHWVPFADWADGLQLLGDRRPTVADLEYHLTTLFPPVRPRQWLEIRYLDSMPDDFWPAVVYTLVALLDDRRPPPSPPRPSSRWPPRGTTRPGSGSVIGGSTRRPTAASPSPRKGRPPSSPTRWSDSCGTSKGPLPR